MNSLAQQSLVELGGRGSVLSRQKRDHIRLDRLLHRLGEVPPGEQPPVLLAIYRLVFPHAFAEESVLWPVMRRLLPDGEELTLRVEREHQQINGLVVRLDALEPASIEHQQLLDRLVELLREDVRDEEDLLLPRLQRELTAAQLRRLGLAWEVVRLIAPTRAHPIVSRRPPGNVLAALPLSLLDRCRDRVDALLHRGAGAAAPQLEALASALARASHAVERLPGMRSGEDPSTRTAQSRRSGWGAAAIATVLAGSFVFALARRGGASQQPAR
ncbi:MAG TPA: hemerythrin domain-containing protein [Geminicoccaceae bacterium]|jgi:hypothetical protein